MPVHDSYSVGEPSRPESIVNLASTAIRPPSPTWSLPCSCSCGNFAVVADMITSHSPPTPSLQSGVHHSSSNAAATLRRSSHHDNHNNNPTICPSSQSPVKRFQPSTTAAPLRTSSFSSLSQGQRSGVEEITSALSGRQARIAGDGPAGGSSDLHPAPEPEAPNLAPQMPSTGVGSKRHTPDSSTILSTSNSTSVAAPSTQATDSDESTVPKRRRPPPPAVKELPVKYEDASPGDLVVLISSMLMELIRLNDKIPLREGRLTRFHSRSPPRISVQEYLQRLTTHATLSPPILLSMVFYIDRLCALYPAFTVSSLTVHRFLISSATVASKGLSDSFWTNKTYARVGGISMPELALLELEFLWRVEWRIVPQPEALSDYYRSLVERCDEYEIKQEEEGAVNNTDNDKEDDKETEKGQSEAPIAVTAPPTTDTITMTTNSTS